MQERANPVLVKSYRAEVVESFHRGVICLVDERGEVVYSQGDITQLAYPRSAMKFFQQLPLIIRKGVEEFGLNEEEIAVLCGSHNGEAQHVELVKGILEKGGFSESDLLCGSQQPTLGKDKTKLILEGKKAGPLTNNCSGKHAGFLLLSKLMGVSHENYIHPSHPIQQEIAKYLSLFYEVPIEEMPIGVDGCSAPIMAFTVKQQAIAYKNLVAPSAFEKPVQQACEQIVQAVLAHPFMIAGTGRYCTELMQKANGQFIGKTGADGVFCMGHIAQKLGLAIKIDDGKMGPQYTVAQAFVEANQWIAPQDAAMLHHYVKAEQKNFAGNQTGPLMASEALSFQYFTIKNQ
jgi:L-asparaginase II